MQFWLKAPQARIEEPSCARPPCPARSSSASATSPCTVLLILYQSALHGVIFSLQLLIWSLWQRGHGHSLNWVHRSAHTGRHRDAHPGMRGLRTHGGVFLRLVLRRGPCAGRAMGPRADDSPVIDMRHHVRDVPLLQGLTWCTPPPWRK